MRTIFGTIFLGSGNLSILQVERLHERLSEAVELLGAMQQPGHPSTEEAAIEEHCWLTEANQELKDMARDIITALGIKPEDLIEKDP